MKPILFSTPMVQAILEGRKTMTRRVVKPQPEWIEQDKKYRVRPGCWYWCSVPRPNIKSEITSYAPYKPGDILWVRETWAEAIEPPDKSIYIYKADGTYCSCWRPSIFMPREAARIFLKVTEVRVERLQDISYDDCLQEGMHDYGTDVDTLGAFQDLWQKLNAKRGYGWDKNPWVWVIGFERIERHGE